MTKKSIRHMVLALLASLVAIPASADARSLITDRFMQDGVKRHYLLHVPSNLDSFAGKRPLVLVIHGGGGTGRGMVRLTRGRFNALADRHGFIVAYPHADQKIWDFGEGEVSERRRRRVDDLRYFRRVIDRIKAGYPVDEKRIFATGISRGGQASWFLACKLPGEIRAIAPFTMPLPKFLADDCRTGPKTGLALFNATADPLVPYEGGPIELFGRKRGAVLSTDASIRLWLKRNRCSNGPSGRETIDMASDGQSVVKTSWRCGRTPVVLYRINNAGHTWPSGKPYLPRIVGPVNYDIDGAVEAWKFFSQFR